MSTFNASNSKKVYSNNVNVNPCFPMSCLIYTSCCDVKVKIRKPWADPRCKYVVVQYGRILTNAPTHYINVNAY